MARRKSRYWHPAVLTAMRDGLDTGASASRVLDQLSIRQAGGELLDEGGKPLPLPSTRTVQDIARDWKRDDSGEWQLTDSLASDVPVVLRVLASVIERSEGRIQALTKREAQLVPSINNAGGGRLTPWIIFRLARYYIHWVAHEPDQDLVTYLAFITDPERLRRNVARGWISQRNMLAEIVEWSEAQQEIEEATTAPGINRR